MADRDYSEAVELALIQQKLHEHTEAITQIAKVNAKQEVQLKVIEDKVDDVQKNTQSIVELFKVAEGTTKTIKWFSSLLMWLSGVAAAVSGIYYTIIHWPDR